MDKGMELERRTITISLNRATLLDYDDDDLASIRKQLDEICTVELADMKRMIERRMGDFVEVTYS